MLRHDQVGLDVCEVCVLGVVDGQQRGVADDVEGALSVRRGHENVMAGHVVNEPIRQCHLHLAVDHHENVRASMLLAVPRAASRHHDHAAVQTLSVEMSGLWRYCRCHDKISKKEWSRDCFI